MRGGALVGEQTKTKSQLFLDGKKVTILVLSERVLVSAHIPVIQLHNRRGIASIDKVLVPQLSVCIHAACKDVWRSRLHKHSLCSCMDVSVSHVCRACTCFSKQMCLHLLKTQIKAYMQAHKENPRFK